MRRAVLLLALLAACATRREPPAPPPAPAPPLPAPPAPVPAEPAAVPAALDPLTDPAFQRAASRTGRFTLAWRPLAGKVPKNEYFEIEVYLYEGTTPVPGAEVIASGWMPDHGHGLIVQPRTVDEGGGRYLVSGMLLHMRGSWELFFDVVKDGLAERAAFALEIG
jgi:hypothetical protein